MPVSCSQSVLTGTDGSIAFKPAGTSFCLLDYTDFAAGTNDINVPASSDFRIGDAVVFTEEGTANIDSAYTAGTTYYVVANTGVKIQVSATVGGTPITHSNDGGTGTADTPGAGNHIKIALADYQSLCQVGEFSVELTRDEIETTTLPCGAGGGSGKYAPTKSFSSGFIDASGTMTVMFTADQTSLANRLIANSLLKVQDGAAVKLYASTVSDGAGGIDDSASLYIESTISIQGFSMSVAPADAQSAEIQFRLNDVSKVFGTTL